MDAALHMDTALANRLAASVRAADPDRYFSTLFAPAPQRPFLFALYAFNAELARVHWDVTERIRIIRRLDFTRGDRIAATYAEHAKILRAVIQYKADQAQLLLRTHIEQSKIEVRKITLSTLFEARAKLQK